MFEYVEMISQWLRSPFMNMAEGAESLPFLYALVLGLVGALAPCQFSGNLSAITLYGTRSVKEGISWSNTFFYVLGKIIAFSALGFIVFLFGQEFQRQLPVFFEPMRKALGPVLVFIGIYMLGAFRMNWFISLWPQRLKKDYRGKFGAFMLGFSFSLGFCPTMFLLFFMLLMPSAMTASYGAVMPAVFAVGTSIPFLFVIGVIAYLGMSGSLMKRGRRVGVIVQRSAGFFLVLAGILDIITFW